MEEPSPEQVAAAATVALANSIASKVMLQTLVTAAATVSSTNNRIVLGALAVGETHLDVQTLDLGLTPSGNVLLNQAADLAREQLEALRKLIAAVEPVDGNG